MTDQQKIATIINAIQDDATLIKLLRLMVTNNIVNVPSFQLDMIMSALGL